MRKKKKLTHKKPFFRTLRTSYFLIFIIISLTTIIAYNFIIKNAIVDQTMLYSWAWIINYLNVKLFFSLLIVSFIVSMFVARIDFKVKEKYFLIIIFVLSFLLSSLTWSSPNPNPDIAEFFGVAKYIELNGLLDYFRNFGTDALKGYRFHSFLLFIGLAFRYFGESSMIVHIITSTLYSFIPVLTFLLSKRLFSRRIAFISSFLVISMPFMLVQSSMFMVDVPTIFFVLLALLTIHIFLHKMKKYYYPLTILTLLLAITSKRPAILFLILSIPVLFLIVKKKNEMDFKTIGKKIFVIIGSLFIILLIFIFLNFNFFSKQIFLDLSQTSIFGSSENYIASVSYFFQIQPLIVLLFLFFLVFFVFRPRLSYLFLFLWIFFPYIFVQGSTIRYLLPAFPAIAIAVAIVISKLKKPIIVFAVSAILLSSTLSVVMGYMPLLKNEFYDNNIKLAAEYVNELENVDSVGVYMNYDGLKYENSPKTEIYGYVFDYYSNERVYYDISESVKAVYKDGFARFNVLDYYKDEQYLTPSYNAVVVFSNTFDYQKINYSDVKILQEVLKRDYVLNKTFSFGRSGIEENKVGFVYLRNTKI